MRYTLTFAPRALATYSRRLSGKDRVVYSVYESIVQVNILQMLGHYGDK